MGEGNNRSRRRGSAALADARATPMDRLDATPFDIGGEVVHVGELSIDQVIALARLLGEAVLKMPTPKKDRLRQIVADKGAGAAAETEANALAILELLDPHVIRRLYGVLLDREEAWVGRNLKLTTSLRVIAAVLRHNDMEELKEAFFEVASHFKGSLGSWLPSSRTSPTPPESPSESSADTASAGSER